MSGIKRKNFKALTIPVNLNLIFTVAISKKGYERFYKIAAPIKRPMRIMHLIAVVLTFLACSCANTQERRNPPTACDLATNEMAMSNYNDSTWIIVKGRSTDSCVLIFLDSIVIKSIRADDIAPLQVLSSIKAKSDGYVAEYFNEIGVALFYKDFRDLFVFIHDQPLESKDGIRKALIEGLSLEVADADDSKAKRKQINSFAKKQIEKHQLDSSEIETVRQVLAEINEDIFD
jgi:hypothetical protein